MARPKRRFANYVELRIVERYRQGEAANRLAQEYHCGWNVIREILDRYGVGIRGRGEAARVGGRMHSQVGVYLPTPEEIAERAAEVRRDWTEEEAQKREQVPAQPFKVPVCKVSRSRPY